MEFLKFNYVMISNRTNNLQLEKKLWYVKVFLYRTNLLLGSIDIFMKSFTVAF